MGSGGIGRSADYPGAALVTSALMLTVYVIVGAGDRGLTAALLLAALALALFTAFTVRQARAAAHCCGCASSAPDC